MKILRNKKYLSVLAAILLLLAVCIGFLLLRPSRDVPPEKGMADLILDSEVDSIQNSSSSSGDADFSRNSSGPSSADTTSSGSSAAENETQDSAGSSESTGENSGDAPQPPASGEEEAPAPGEDEKPAESTNRHPYELPLVPVNAS